MFGFSMAHWIMVLIAIGGFSTVVMVLYFGTREPEHRPSRIEDSQAAGIWLERAQTSQAARAEQAQQEAEEETAES